jgi:hypothetical protein
MLTNELAQQAGGGVARPGAVVPYRAECRWKPLVAVTDKGGVAGRQRTDSPRRGLGEREGRRRRWFTRED